jgi:hypothetical protein
MRLAERLDGPLGLAESTWLDEHLVGCPSCTAIAASYEEDRLALRALRDQPPDPPRDLWARTSAAIEAESRFGTAATPRRRLGRLPIGALSGLTVVALFVGVSLLSGSISIYPSLGNGVTGEGSGDRPSSASASLGPASLEPTPFAVGAGAVGWIDQGPDGGFHTATVDEVCPVKSAAGCPRLEASRDSFVAFNRATKTIVGSPTRPQAVAIAKSTSAGDEVVVVALPDNPDEPSTSAAPASETPAPETPSPSTAPASSAPSASSASPTIEPPVQPSASPSLSAEPTVAAKVAIASGIDVVGESAAYSPDGTWFAFTARPADGSGGPDVYVWRVGDEHAARVTDDGASYFASWSGNRLIASRPADIEAEDPRPVTVRIDPATRAEADAGDLWRPAVDPTGRFAIAWDGSLERADGTWAPARGSLELRRWTDEGPRSATGPKASRVVADEAAGDFDVRWDEAGEWVAVWIAETPDSQVGKLTLYHVDQANVRLESADGAPTQESAMPGFSMGDGRLAWATPPGEGGEGSRIQIAAWSESGVGIVESGPGDQLVVIR